MRAPVQQNWSHERGQAEIFATAKIERLTDACLILIRTHQTSSASCVHVVLCANPHEKKCECYYLAMARTPLFSWEGREYRFEEKSADWYWALGIIATAGAIASILFGNILLALVIVAAAMSIALAAAKHSRIHRFAIYNDGISIDENLYLFKDMNHFSVLEYVDETLPPSLSLKTNHILAPHLLIPIVGHDPLEIYEYISLHLPEGRHDESAMDRVIELFRL